MFISVRFIHDFQVPGEEQLKSCSLINVEVAEFPGVSSNTSRECISTTNVWFAEKKHG